MTADAGRWHQLAGAIDASNLPASDRSVFRMRLKRADYKTAELPARFTRPQAAVAREAGITVRQVRRSERHLERHGWLKISGGNGRGHTLSYVLLAGLDCDCTGRRHEPKPDAAKADTGEAEGGHHVRIKADTEGGHAAAQTPVSTERHREGEGKRGRPEPDWPLVRQIIRTVRAAPGGGLHRAELAEICHLPPYGEAFRTALMIAYKRGRGIDFCGRYVVRTRP